MANETFFKKNYHNSRCKYSIRLPQDTCNIQVEYRKFTVDCNGDFLRIGNKAVCGAELGTVLYPVQAYQASIVIEFVTNSEVKSNTENNNQSMKKTSTKIFSSQVAAEGFDIELKRLPCSPDQEDIGIDNIRLVEENSVEQPTTKRKMRICSTVVGFHWGQWYLLLPTMGFFQTIQTMDQ